MRAILKEGLLPQNNADTYSQSSDSEDSGKEVEILQDVEMKEETAEAQRGNSKNVKNRSAYFGGMLLDKNATRFVESTEIDHAQIKTFDTQ